MEDNILNILLTYVGEVRTDVKEILAEQSKQNSRITALETTQKYTRWLVGSVITLLGGAAVDMLLNHLGRK